MSIHVLILCRLVYLCENKQKPKAMTTKIQTPDFKLFFGKHKGMFLSQTPLSYQQWLVQTEFFDNLKIKYPRYKVYRSADGGIDHVTVMLTIEIPCKEERYELTPEEKYYRGATAWFERDSY
jgi:hypothetical protein